MLHRTHTEEEAVLRYEDADFALLHQGRFHSYADCVAKNLLEGRYVRCAVSGEKIPLEILRYWNVDLQEPYRSAVEAMQRWRELQQGS